MYYNAFMSPSENAGSDTVDFEVSITDDAATKREDSLPITSSLTYQSALERLKTTFHSKTLLANSNAARLVAYEEALRATDYLADPATALDAKSFETLKAIDPMIWAKMQNYRSMMRNSIAYLKTESKTNELPSA
jgi:threonine synthase